MTSLRDRPEPRRGWPQSCLQPSGVQSFLRAEGSPGPCRKTAAAADGEGRAVARETRRQGYSQPASPRGSPAARAQSRAAHTREERPEWSVWGTGVEKQTVRLNSKSSRLGGGGATLRGAGGWEGSFLISPTCLYGQSELT